MSEVEKKDCEFCGHNIFRNECNCEHRNNDCRCNNEWKKCHEEERCFERVFECREKKIVECREKHRR